MAFRILLDITSLYRIYKYCILPGESTNTWQLQDTCTTPVTVCEEANHLQSASRIADNWFGILQDDTYSSSSIHARQPEDFENVADMPLSATERYGKCMMEWMME